MGEEKRPDIGRRLRKIRTLCGYGKRGQQKAFAHDFGFTQGEWNHWEKGNPPPPWQRSIQIIEAVEKRLPGLTLDYIYRDLPDGLPLSLARVLFDDVTAADRR